MEPSALRHRHLPAQRALLALVAGALLGAAEAIEEVQDVRFLPEAREERLDLYLPAKDGQAHPGVVIVHGGGWAHRRRRDRAYVDASRKLAGAGFVVACIEYEIADQGRLGRSYLHNMAAAFPQNVQDVKSAVRFLRANAARYAVDPARIAVIGASAGGHLAALAAVTQPGDGLEPADDGHGDASSAVHACVSYYGVHDFTGWGGSGRDGDEDQRRAQQASPIRYVDRADPPMLLIHGTRDRTVPFAQSEAMAAKLKEAGVVHRLVALEGKDHGTFYNPAKGGIDDHALVVGFLREHLAGRATAP